MEGGGLQGDWQKSVSSSAGRRVQLEPRSTQSVGPALIGASASRRACDAAPKCRPSRGRKIPRSEAESAQWATRALAAVGRAERTKSSGIRARLRVNGDDRGVDARSRRVLVSGDPAHVRPEASEHAGDDRGVPGPAHLLVFQVLALAVRPADIDHALHDRLAGRRVSAWCIACGGRASVRTCRRDPSPVGIVAGASTQHGACY